jgi:hypothetical protein
MKTTPPCNHWREAIRLRVGGALEAEEFVRVETHLATCAACRLYAKELRAAADGLRWLAERPIEPSSGFRARWTRAVEAAAQPRGFGETAAALADWCRGFLLRNLRPALALAPLWILTLLFWFSAPEPSSMTQTTAAHSPVEIVRALGGQQPLLAWRSWKWDSQPVSPARPQPVHPRSEASPARPAAQSVREPDAQATFELMLPNLIAQRVPLRFHPYG